MQRIEEIDLNALSGLKVLLSDIDDTISTHGKITAGAYQALWTLHDAGIRVVIVTGRPAGWCDHIARFWPVDAVVGENGGFYFFQTSEKLERRFLYPAGERAKFRQRLDRIRKRILDEVPGCAVASDQPYREYDLAIDFCEDVPPLPREDILRIQSIFSDEGAHAKISSIHVNGWFGDFDKLRTSRQCLIDLFDIDLDLDNASCAFCGDSPNDEPMFACFKISFGMKNLEAYLDLIRSKPAYITSKSYGAGFQEVVDGILTARRNSG